MHTERSRAGQHTFGLRLATLLTGWVLFILCTPGWSDAPAPRDSWLDIVRETPYWDTQGTANNLVTIRRWVLLSQSYCSEPERHLLFDHRGRFLAYIDNTDTAEATTRRLNDTRRRLAEENRVASWSPGALTELGFPFALACHQPFADMEEAIARLTGEGEDYRVWGTWDDISVGAPDQPVSLVELFRTVYEHRKKQGRFSFPDTVMPNFLGKTIIESGGQKNALSRQAAKGIMQLRPAVLNDCEIPEQHHLHRMAQVDCALRLVEQNHRNLQAPFERVFGQLPAEKQEALYALLLTQAYQIGVGRTTELIEDETLGKAAQYFAENHVRFSAGDIQMGMIYHNMGRRDIGLRTLYYVTDIRIAREALCAADAMADNSWCDH